MEIYQAIADFEPPAGQTNRNILEFVKGETFEIYHRPSGRLTDWWGARSLRNNITGYVPAKYMKYVEKVIGTELPENYVEDKEKKIKHFEDMQNSFYPNHPSIQSPETPVPDYDDYNNKSFQFLRNFESVLSHADLDNIEVAEPEPDYNNEDDDNLPSPPPPITVNDSLENKLNGHPPPASVMKPPTENVIPQIQPKKIGNPCLVSNERQALHKELLFNYKRGVNILQKPELNKILEKRKEVQRLKEWEGQQSNKRTSLELKLEERANKMKEEENSHLKSISEKNENTPEYLKMHAKITHKAPDN